MLTHTKSLAVLTTSISYIQLMPYYEHNFDLVDFCIGTPGPVEI